MFEGIATNCQDIDVGLALAFPFLFNLMLYSVDPFCLRFVRLRLNSALAVELSLIFYECTATG